MKLDCFKNTREIAVLNEGKTVDWCQDKDICWYILSNITVLAFPFSSVEDNKEDDKMADLLSDFQQQLTLQESSVKLCQPEVDVSQTHISGMS